MVIKGRNLFNKKTYLKNIRNKSSDKDCGLPINLEDTSQRALWIHARPSNPMLKQEMKEFHCCLAYHPI